MALGKNLCHRKFYHLQNVYKNINYTFNKDSSVNQEFINNKNKSSQFKIMSLEELEKKRIEDLIKNKDNFCRICSKADHHKLDCFFIFCDVY